MKIATEFIPAPTEEDPAAMKALYKFQSGGTLVYRGVSALAQAFFLSTNFVGSVEGEMQTDGRYIFRVSRDEDRALIEREIEQRGGGNAQFYPPNAKI